MSTVEPGASRPLVGPLVRDVSAPRAAGVAGLLFAALFIGAILLVRSQPAAESSSAEIAEWYLRGDSKRVALVSLYLAPFAGIAFLWFIAVIRSHVGDREDRFFATVFLGSGLLFVAMLFAAAAAAGAPLLAVKFQGAPAPEPRRDRACACARVHVPLRLRRACGRSVHDLRFDAGAPHREPPPLARDRRLRGRA